ncbi:MAG TPA: hypothetical protein VHU18_11220 [Rhizomicrobium sp.]|jgi:hypothetical protein|nr:hypothetical protein [Rhizomicrobium sp.]
MRILSAAAFAFIPTCALANGQGPSISLDAPVSQTPTVRTEIQRGWAAANKCDSTLGALGYGECIFKLSNEEGSRLTDAKPFTLGLMLNAWFTEDLLVGVDVKMTTNVVAQRELPEARRQAAADFVIVRELQRKIGLSDSQVCAVPISEEHGAAERWAYWLKQNPKMGDDGTVTYAK